MTQLLYPKTSLLIVGVTPMKLVRLSETDVRVYAFDSLVAGDFVVAPDHVASLQYGQGDDVESVSEADFESAVERLRAEHARLAADPQAVARTYYEFNGQPVLIAQQVGRTPFAYIVLSDTGELAWSSHHLLAIVFKHDPAAHEISRADYEQRVAKVRAARKAG